MRFNGASFETCFINVMQINGEFQLRVYENKKKYS